MRCKNHITDLSSNVGVCASCLRQRLSKIILAQEQAAGEESLEQNNFNSMLQRSVSPISRRKSVNSVNPVASIQRPNNKPRLNHSQSDTRFYNSPQITINTGGCIGSSSYSFKKPTLIRFPSISNLFRSNSRNGDANHSDPSSFYAGAGRNQRCVRDRGMSPVRSSGDDEFSDRSSYQSSESCKHTPVKTPSHQVVRRGGGRKSVTELLLCPLVHASPNRLLNAKGKSPVDGGFSGDIRVPAPAVPHLAYVKSFSGNRSRKITNFGRSDSNR